MIVWPQFLQENGEVWDIGQLSKEDKRALDREVKDGRAIKERVPWLYMLGSKRSHWIAL